MHTGTISSGGGNSLVLREEMRLDGRRMKAQFWGSRGPKKAVYTYIYKERSTIILNTTAFYIYFTQSWLLYVLNYVFY